MTLRHPVEDPLTPYTNPIEDPLTSTQTPENPLKSGVPNVNDICIGIGNSRVNDICVVIGNGGEDMFHREFPM